MKTETKRFWVKEAIKYYLLCKDVDNPVFTMPGIQQMYFDGDRVEICVDKTHPHYKYIAEVIRVRQARLIVEDLERLGMHNVSIIAMISANNPYSENDYDAAIYSDYNPDDSDYLKIQINMPLDPDTCKPITFPRLDFIKAYIAAAFVNEYIAISCSDVDMYIENMLLNYINFDE